MRHEEMMSSFVQYDVGNLVCAPLILSRALCCVQVFIELLYKHVVCHRGAA